MTGDKLHVTGGASITSDVIGEIRWSSYVSPSTSTPLHLTHTLYNSGRYAQCLSLPEDTTTIYLDPTCRDGLLRQYMRTGNPFEAVLERTLITGAESLNVKLTHVASDEIIITIYDELGNLQRRGVYAPSDLVQREIQIDPTGLSNGAYRIRITQLGESRIVGFVVRR